MILNDQQDCGDSFAETLDQASEWRTRTATKHPDDTRNIKAAEILKAFAADSANLTDEQ